VKAAVLRAAGRVEIVEKPVPEPGPGEARVRIEACGLCGTDLHFYASGPMIADVTPGHEMAGRVDALGEGVAEFSVGDRVVVEPLSTCGTCAPCRRGRDSICTRLQLFGLHRDGGFAEYVSVPARRLFRTPDELEPRLAALAEPVAVVIHGLRRGRLEAGERVLVLGAGTLGLLSLVAARDAGADEVWISARHEHQAELATELGAHRVLREPEAEPADLARLTAETPFDLVVETVGGRADTLRAAGGAVGPGGRIAVLGVFMAPVTVDTLPLLLKESDLLFSNCYDRTHERVDFEAAIDLIARHRERLASIATHRVPLDEIADAYNLAAEKKRGVVKVSIHP
jgi:L-iditol 2-dehydrogenase